MMENRSPRINWLHIILLVIIFSGTNNCYWLTLYGVTSLGGNKFVNGILLGLSELTSGVFAGIVISYSSPKHTFQICSIIGIVFNFVVNFMLEDGTALSYGCIFIAILGVGGSYNCLYTMIGTVIPSE